LAGALMPMHNVRDGAAASAALLTARTNLTRDVDPDERFFEASSGATVDTTPAFAVAIVHVATIDCKSHCSTIDTVFVKRSGIHGERG
jgi:hypothetical protein